MEQQHTIKFLRKRKFMLVMPILVLPFVTLAFWALGGGKGTDTQAAQDVPTGLNINLPGANFQKDRWVDKMSFYEKAAADSAKLNELIKKDPYLKQSTVDTNQELSTKYPVATIYTSKPGSSNTAYQSMPIQDPNEEKVYRKLDQINAALNASTAGTPSVIEEDAFPAQRENNTDVERLEQMMNTLSNSSTGENAEMKQINSMLEKILDIQHPDRMKDRIQEKSLENKQQVFTVTKSPLRQQISLLDTAIENTIQKMDESFFGIDPPDETEIHQNAIEAVIHERQMLVNGSDVKMRLLNNIYINGQLIPKDHFVYGKASLNHERLEINVSSIQYAHSVFPVRLAVYNIDGIPGLYIPGAITRDVTKQSTDNALQSVALNSLNPSIGAQAASAGIETAKSLLSKKVKLVRVQVKAGYRILLKDKNESE